MNNVYRFYDSTYDEKYLANCDSTSNSTTEETIQTSDVQNYEERMVREENESVLLSGEIPSEDAVYDNST